MSKENIVISLGGSLVAPNEIDIALLKAFRQTIKKYLNQYRFFIFVGGGKISRTYQKAMLEFGADAKERDIIGIDVSRLNARVVKELFGELAFSEVVTNPTKRIITRKDIVVAGGWKPGWSTDYCAVTLAKNLGVKKIVNLTNVDYVYDKNPIKFKNAKAYKEIGWKDFRKIVGNKWTPGLSVPFDPRASRDAEVLQITVAMINGKKLERLEHFLQNKDFIGTIIS